MRDVPGAHKAEEARGVYDLMGKVLDTTNKAEGDKCYDKGKKEMCRNKGTEALNCNWSFLRGIHRGGSI